jgi:hypothetical protein
MPLSQIPKDSPARIIVRELAEKIRLLAEE